MILAVDDSWVLQADSVESALDKLLNIPLLPGETRFVVRLQGTPRKDRFACKTS